MKNFEVFGHRTFLLNNRIIFKLLQHNIAQDFLCKTFWLTGCPLGGAPCLFHHFCRLCLQHHAYSLLCILGLSVLGYNEEIQSQFQLNALSPPLKVLCFFFFLLPGQFQGPCSVITLAQQLMESHPMQILQMHSPPSLVAQMCE